MEFEMPKTKVYIQVDSNYNIIAVNSSIFLPDVTDWIEIDEGDGDKYSHAQGNYFDKPLRTELGAYRYQWIDNEVREKTDQEISEELSSIPSAPLSEFEKLKQRQDATEDAVLVLMMINGGMF